MACHSAASKAHFRLLDDILEAARPELFAKTASDFRRGGPLSPRLLLMLLLSMVGDAGRRGYQLLLESFWHDADRVGCELPTEQPVSAAALCQARQKIDPHAVRSLVHLAAAHFERHFGQEHRWLGRRIVAVDGSRATTQRSQVLFERYGSPFGGHCPQITVSTLFDLVSKVPLDVAVGPYGTDERKVLIEEHLEHLREGDVLVLDRGYPSFETLCYLEGCPADFALRVRTAHGFPAVTRFLESGSVDAEIEITLPAEYRTRGIAPIRVRAVRIERTDAPPIVVLTSLGRTDFSVAEIGELYHRRWAIEEYYKLTKGIYLGHRGFRARSPDGVEQEVFAQALFIAISRHLMAAAAAQCRVPYEELSQKRGMLTTAQRLTDLLLASDPPKAIDLIDRLCLWIASRRAPPRPGRRFPRRSLSRPSRWGLKGKRGVQA